MKLCYHSSFWRRIRLFGFSKFTSRISMCARFLVILSASCWILSSAVLIAADSKPILIVNDNSNQGVGSVLYWDCPVFAAYSNGEVIWRRNWASSIDAFRISLGHKADPIVKKLIQSVADYNGQTFTLTSSSDPDETTIVCNQSVVKIKGNWRKPFHFENKNLERLEKKDSTNNKEEKLWTSLPPAIREALTELATFDDVDSKRWQPEKLEVILFPAGPALGDPMSWPDSWPHSFSLLPGSGISKSIELPGDMLDQVMKLVARDGKPRAVILEGEKKFARIRFKFPGE